jgi:hypothetical protein
MKKSAKLKTFFITLFWSFILALSAKAANINDAFKIGDGGNSDTLDAAASKAGYKTTVSSTGINGFINNAIQIVLGLLGIIFIVLIIYGGITWTTAGGDETKVEQAQKTIKNSVIGLIIVIAAYAITYFVISAISSQTLVNN